MNTVKEQEEKLIQNEWIVKYGSVPQKAKFVVMGAGTNIVNGYYEENGIHNHKPKYRQIGANGQVILHNGKPIEICCGGGWCMGIWVCADKGWVYDINQAINPSLPPKDGWNVTNNGIAPLPTINFFENTPVQEIDNNLKVFNEEKREEKINEIVPINTNRRDLRAENKQKLAEIEKRIVDREKALADRDSRYGITHIPNQEVRNHVGDDTINLNGFYSYHHYKDDSKTTSVATTTKIVLKPEDNFKSYWRMDGVNSDGCFKDVILTKLAYFTTVQKKSRYTDRDDQKHAESDIKKLGYEFYILETGEGYEYYIESKQLERGNIIHNNKLSKTEVASKTTLYNTTCECLPSGAYVWTTKGNGKWDVTQQK